MTALTFTVPPFDPDDAPSCRARMTGHANAAPGAALVCVLTAGHDVVDDEHWDGFNYWTDADADFRQRLSAAADRRRSASGAPCPDCHRAPCSGSAYCMTVERGEDVREIEEVEV
jgi:hypothetical protein